MSDICLLSDLANILFISPGAKAAFSEILSVLLWHLTLGSKRWQALQDAGLNRKTLWKCNVDKVWDIGRQVHRGSRRKRSIKEGERGSEWNGESEKMKNRKLCIIIR